jgi:hypothetical protein
MRRPIPASPAAPHTKETATRPKGAKGGHKVSQGDLARASAATERDETHLTRSILQGKCGIKFRFSMRWSRPRIVLQRVLVSMDPPASLTAWQLIRALPGPGSFALLAMSLT